MSTLKSSSADLTLNADGSGNDIKFQSNASEVGSLTAEGLLSTTTITASGVVTGATVEATGDTAAGDNAAIGYTAAEGLILTGQGSTSDVTLKNDADVTVFTVPTGTDDILFADNAKAMWGTGSDLQIWHDGSHSRIKDTGTGNINIHTSNLNIVNAAGSEDMAYFTEDGLVSLYYNGTEKFRTADKGIAVQGNPGDSTSYGVIDVNSETSGTGTGILFMKGDGTAIGRISVVGGSNSVSYVTSSDYRMKQDIADMDSVWDTIKALQPRKFKWKSNVAGGYDTGFVAHEAGVQIPRAISGIKDGTKTVENAVLTASGALRKVGVTEAEWTEAKDADPAIYASDTTWSASATVPEYQMIDTEKLIPYLTKALQEAIAEIETLKTKVTALENA